MMGKCFIKLSPLIYEQIWGAEIDDSRFFLENGQLTDEKMDISNIPQTVEMNSPRDSRPFHQQRAVLLTHESTRERYISRIINGLSIGSLIANTSDQHAKKRLQDAAKFVGSMDKAKERNRKAKEKRNRMTVEEKELELQIRKKKRKKIGNWSIRNVLSY